MSFVGMDPEAIRRVAEALRTSSGHLGTVTDTIERLVNDALAGWEGTDAQDFSQTWQGEHRAALATAIAALEKMAASALEDATEQDQTSSVAGMPSGPGAVPTAPGGSNGSGGGSGGGGSDSGDGGGGDGGEGPSASVSDEKHYGVNKDLDDAKSSDSDSSTDPDSDSSTDSATSSDADSDGDSTSDSAGGTKDDGPGVDVKLGEAEVDVAVAETGGKVEGEYGSAEYEASLLGANAGVEGSVSKDGVKVSAEAAATLAAASGAAGVKYGHASAGVSGEAQVGAFAEGEATIGLTGENAGVHASGELFAGASAGVDGNVEVAGVGVGGNAEVKAGIGIGGRADIGMEDGKFTIGVEGTAVLGLGGTLGGEVTIDPGAVVDAVDDVIPDIDMPDIDLPDIDRPGWLGG